LENGNITTYAFYDLSEETRRNDYDIQKIAIYLITMKSSLLSEYKDYRDVFSSAEYIERAENPQIAHTINLIEDIITHYRLIYHFSEKELRVLREYLKKN
jgi:hypothetical protein